MHRRTPIAAAALLAVVATACSGTTSDERSDPLASEAAESLTPNTRLAAAIASFDLTVGEDRRLLIGLFGPEQGVIGGGEIEVRVGALTSDEVVLSAPMTATFLPVPGSEPEVGDSPGVITGAGAGVYQVEVDFDQPGNWGAQVTLELDGESVTATAAFPVAAESTLPQVGDPAPRVDNPVIGDPGVDPIAIDSRAQGDDPTVPAPELHDERITDLLDAGRPFVVVISTPVYCVSRFCGPITDHVAELDATYADRAAFVHLEVWQDFEAQALNPFVEPWILDPQTGGNEPWVFLVGADGVIQQRWDNVLDADELAALLEALPAA